MHKGLFAAVLAVGFAACGGASPTAPSDVLAQAIPLTGAQQATAAVTATLIEVAGTVNDAAWRPIPSARVEVIDGPQAGLSTIANAKGEFRLTGTFDETTHFRATKDGHVAATKAFPPACPPCNPDWWIHFYLEADSPHVDISGEYTLTFIANPSCTTLPDEARTRTYGATITPAAGSTDAAGSRFDVRVSSPTILASFSSFTIGAVADYVSFEIGDPGHSGAGLVEQVAPNRYVTLDGAISTVVTDASTITAALNGAVNVCELAGVFGTPYGCGGPGGVGSGGCHSTNHQFVMRRRAQ